MHFYPAKKDYLAVNLLCVKIIAFGLHTQVIVEMLRVTIDRIIMLASYKSSGTKDIYTFFYNAQGECTATYHKA